MRGRVRHVRGYSWWLVAAIMVLVPLGFNLARQASYPASLEIFPGNVGEFEAIRDPGYYREFLDDPVLRREMRRNVRARPNEYRRAGVRGTRRGTVVVTVQAGTPQRARRIVNALAVQMAGASSRQLDQAVNNRIAVVSLRLRRTRSPVERRALRRWIRDLRRFPSPRPQRVGLPQRPGPAQPRRWADRLAAAMPGGFEARHEPMWAAVAGGAVALALWMSARLLRRRRSIAASPAAGDGGEDAQPDEP